MYGRTSSVRSGARRASRAAVAAAAIACLIVLGGAGGVAAAPVAGAPVAAAPSRGAVTPSHAAAATLGPWRLSGPTRTLVDALHTLGTGGGSLLTLSVDGVRRSADGGVTWAEPAGLPATHPGATTSSSEVAVLASDPDVAYLLDSTRSSSAPYDATSGTSLYRTGDAGASWTRVGGDALTGRIVFDIAVVPSAVGPPVVLVLDGETGILRSTDGGLTFVPAIAGIVPDASVGAISVGSIAAGPDIGVAYAASPTQLYVTRDAGASWRIACVASDAMPCGRPTVAPGDGALVLLAGSEGIVRSTDAGATWSRVGAGVLPGPDTGGIDSIVASATHPAVVLASGIAGLFRSGDGGATWIPWDGGIPAASLGSSDRVAMDGTEPTHAWRVHETRFFTSEDGGRTWRELRGPDATGTPAYAALARERTPAVLGTTDGIVTRTDLEWARTSPAKLAMAFAADPGDALRLYAATYADGVVRSSDGGLTWEPWSTGLPHTIAWSVAPLVARDGWALLATDAGPWERERDGARWVPLGTGLPDAGSRSIVALSDGAVLVGLETRGIWRLDRGADAWRPLGLDGRTVLSITAGPGDGHVLLAATEARGLYRSADAGRTWRQVASTTASAAVAYDPVTRLFALATGARVALSADDGLTWRTATTGLPAADGQRPWYRRTTSVAAMAGGGFLLTSFSGAFVAVPEAGP